MALSLPLLLALSPDTARAVELCNGVDDDGDADVDEGPVIASFDGDGDGHGDADRAELYPDCAAAGAAIPDVADCDDDDPAVLPGAAEACDADDDDCDGLFDDGACPGTVNTEDDSAWMAVATAGTWGAAVDGCGAIGWGIATPSDFQQQEGLAREVLSGGPYWIGLTDAADEGRWDWVDGSASVYANWALGQPDGGTYENCAAIGATGEWFDRDCTSSLPYTCERRCTVRMWYDDDDGDGLGDPADDSDECEAPAGYVANALDCNDGRADLPAVFYVDEDGDGVGTAPVVACAGARKSGDCDDQASDVYPGAPEVPEDGIDQDCDGYDATLSGTTGDTGAGGTSGTTTGPGTPGDSGTGGTTTGSGTPGPGTSGTPGSPTSGTTGAPEVSQDDSDGDGVPDAVDPDPLDPGGATPGRLPALPGCGCRAAGNGGAAAWAAVPWLGALLARRRRTRTAGR